MNPSLTTNQHHHDRCSHRETNRSVRSRCGSAKPPRRDTVAEPMESQKADSSVGCGSTKEKDAAATPPACRYPHRLSETKPNCTVDTKPRNAGTAGECQSFHAMRNASSHETIMPLLLVGILCPHPDLIHNAHAPSRAWCTCRTTPVLPIQQISAITSHIRA